MAELLSNPTLPVFAPDPPARWVFPEVTRVLCKSEAESWPKRLFCETTGQWVEFETPAALRAATLEIEPVPLPDRTPWTGGRP